METRVRVSGCLTQVQIRIRRVSWLTPHTSLLMFLYQLLNRGLHPPHTLYPKGKADSIGEPVGKLWDENTQDFQ